MPVTVASGRHGALQREPIIKTHCKGSSRHICTAVGCSGGYPGGRHAMVAISSPAMREPPPCPAFCFQRDTRLQSAFWRHLSRAQQMAFVQHRYWALTVDPCSPRFQGLNRLWHGLGVDAGLCRFCRLSCARSACSSSTWTLSIAMVRTARPESTLLSKS